MTGQIIGYIRVSSTVQILRQLKAVWEVEETFTDHVSSGSREMRTAVWTMLCHVRRGDAEGTPCKWRRWTA